MTDEAREVDRDRRVRDLLEKWSERDGRTTVGSFDDRGHALMQVIGSVRYLEDAAATVRVNVDKARRDCQAFCIDPQRRFRFATDVRSRRSCRRVRRCRHRTRDFRHRRRSCRSELVSRRSERGPGRAEKKKYAPHCSQQCRAPRNDDALSPIQGACRRQFFGERRFKPRTHLAGNILRINEFCRSEFCHLLCPKTLVQIQRGLRIPGQLDELRSGGEAMRDHFHRQVEVRDVGQCSRRVSKQFTVLARASSRPA